MKVSKAIEALSEYLAEGDDPEIAIMWWGKELFWYEDNEGEEHPVSDEAMSEADFALGESEWLCTTAYDIIQEAIARFDAEKDGE